MHYYSIIIAKQAEAHECPSNYFGIPGGSRTCNLFLRTELLYPIELPRHSREGEPPLEYTGLSEQSVREQFRSYRAHQR